MDTKKKQLMKKKRHRHFWNRFFGFMLVLLLTIGGVQTIASGNLAIDDVVLEVEDYSVAEFMEADPEPAYVSIVPMIESAPVTTAAAFRAAILNPDYTVINIGASFSVAFSGTGTNSVPTLTRSVRINGHGHTITATNAESVTTLGVVADPTTLTLDNITFTRTGTGLAYIFAAATTTANWTVRLQDYVRTGTGNVTAGTARHTQQTYGWIHPMTWRGGTTSNTGTNAEPNRGGLVNAQSSRVVVAGIGNRLGMHGAAGGDRHHLWVRDFEMLANASLYITSGGDSGGAIRIANSGAVDIREHANLNIQNVGTRDVSPAITVATVSGWAPVTSSVQSNGLSGSIGRTTLHAGANVHIEAHYHAFVSVVSHDFEMKDGAVMNLITNHARGIGFLMAPNLRPGDHANPNDRSQVYNVSLQGEGTQLNIFSNNNFVFNAGASFTLQGNNSSIVVEDGATMQVYGARTSAVVVSGTGTVFDVNEGGTIRAMSRTAPTSGLGATAAAAFRFRLAGSMTFNIDGGDVYIIAGPNQPNQALRLFGGANAVYVRNQGRLSVRHYGTTANNNAVDPAGVALLYQDGNTALAMADRFYLTDRYSQVDLYSRNGIGISGDVGSGATRPVTRIQANPGTIFTVDGSRPAGQAVFRGGNLRFDIDNPLYFDFRNRGGGRVFTAEAAASAWIGTNTDLAVWGMVPATFAGDPVDSWSRINFHITGVNFATNIASVVAPGAVLATANATDTAAFQARHNGAGGLLPRSPNFGRISANNATPIVDWLRIPTNADMRIFGHVSVQEGRPIFTRSAWEGEVWVDVVFRNPAGNIVFEAEGVTDNRSMFGEPARDGIFEVVFAPSGTPELLPEGYTIEVVNARRWAGGRTEENINRYHPARIPQDIRSSIERTRDVMPPRQVELPAALATSIPSNTTNISGTTDPYSVIRISINNTWVMEGAVPRTVQADSTGAFTFPLTGATLEHGQAVRIHASDERAMNIQRLQPPFAIPHDLFDIVNSPITVAPNNGIPRTAGTPTLNGHVVNGNIHWIDATSFHDVTIPAATMRLVEHVGNITLSVPDTIDFGVMVVGPGARFGDRLPHAPILVTDSRLVRDAWRVEAILADAPLTNVVMSHTLPNGLVRRHGDGAGGFMSSVITPHAAVIFHSHTPPSGGGLLSTEITDISAPWNNINNGLMVETFGEMVRVGNYNTIIEWSIMPGIPD